MLRALSTWVMSPYDGDYTAWMTIARDGSEFAAWFFKPTARPEEAYINLRLNGLDPDALYRSLDDGREYSGAALMNLGLPIEWRNGDDFSQMWRFERVAKLAPAQDACGCV